MKATYTKLRDESWGIRVQGIVTAGDVVTVTKRDGETKDEIVNAVLWSGNDQKTGHQTCLCSIVKHDKPTGKSSGREMCAECGQRSGVVMARDSSGIRALCCRRCASGPDWERSFA